MLRLHNRYLGNHPLHVQYEYSNHPLALSNILKATTTINNWYLGVSSPQTNNDLYNLILCQTNFPKGVVIFQLEQRCRATTADAQRHKYEQVEHAENIANIVFFKTFSKPSSRN